MTTETQVAWKKAGRNEWTAEVGDKRLRVTRIVRQRSWSYEPQFPCVGRKPRRHLSTTLVYATVRVGNEIHRLTRPDGIYSVKDAKAAAVRYASTGQGSVTVVNLEDGQ